MEGTDYRFHKNDRVRLRAVVDPSFYGGYACVGNEGWIRKRRRDTRFGLPEVYIEWDKNHWTYNGAENRWTFEDHFDLVEESMPDNNDELMKSFAAFLESREQAAEAPKKKKSTGPNERIQGIMDRYRQSLADTDSDEEEADETEADEYANAIVAANEILGECEGFILVGVARKQIPEAPQGVLIPLMFNYSTTPESEVLALASIATHVAQAHQDLAAQTIAYLTSGE